ncbi:MAG TPA: hypothetical protein VMX17_14890 [Candidatus Glassbacteria bacterium]|nr:hypothetical protein [Candidatus Glassbacteria bacterium]
MSKPQQTLFIEEAGAIKSLYPRGSKKQEIEEKFKDIMYEELKLGLLRYGGGN